MLPQDGSIADLFMALVAIPSPSGRELALGEQIRDWLAGAGVPAAFDDAGAANGSDAGNLIARVPGAPGAPTVLFVAHMDTVESGTEPIRPALGDDGVIRSAGDTVLGADNKAAVAAVMIACRAGAGQDPEHRPSVVAAFTCCEESGRMGAGLLDVASLAVDCAVSVDGARPIGTVIARALGQTTFTLTVRGRAAHAAADPDAGINAIAAAGELVAALPLGRQPQGGSASVAAIVGGSVIDTADAAGSGRAGGDVVAALRRAPTNSVPDVAHVRGEVRGYSVAEIEDTVAAIELIAVELCERRGAVCELQRDRSRMVPPLPAAPDSRAKALVAEAITAVPGLALTLEDRQATLEANYLAAAGVDVVAIASGGRDPHQLTESIAVTALDQLQALLLAIVERAGTRARG